MFGVMLRVIERAGERARVARLVEQPAAAMFDEHRPGALVRDHGAKPRGHRFEDAAAKGFGLERGVNIKRCSSADAVELLWRAVELEATLAP